MAFKGFNFSIFFLFGNIIKNYANILSSPYDIFVAQIYDDEILPMIPRITDDFYRIILGYNDIEYEQERQNAILYFSLQLNIDMTESILLDDGISYGINGAILNPVRAPDTIVMASNYIGITNIQGRTGFWQLTIQNSSQFTGNYNDGDVYAFGFYSYQFEKGQPLVNIRVKSEKPFLGGAQDRILILKAEYSDNNGGYYVGNVAGGFINGFGVRIIVTLKKSTYDPCSKGCSMNTFGKPCIDSNVNSNICYDMMKYGGCPPNTKQCAILTKPCVLCDNIKPCLFDDGNGNYNCVSFGKYKTCPDGSNVCNEYVVQRNDSCQYCDINYPCLFDNDGKIFCQKTKKGLCPDNWNLCSYD